LADYGNCSRVITLRNDQLKLKFDVYSGWNSGNRNMLAVLPTGGGKSIVVADIAKDKDLIGAQQVVIAHRNELVGQMSMHVARRGVHHRIIGPKDVVARIIRDQREEFNGFSFINPKANCSVGGIDTLQARADELNNWAAQIDNWTIDEAHHVTLLNKWGKGVAMFPRAYGLGVTATPSRADGLGLGRHADGVFDAMVCGPTMRELIDMGALTDYEIAIPESDFHIDDDAVAPSGDFSQKRMREASKRSHIVGDVVAEYTKRAFGKRAICFATDVETAGEIAKKFNDAGIPSAAVSAKTPDEVRADYIKRFRDGRVWVLVNVDLFGEGFDVPACEVVIMARPTASLGVYLQQFGRALRTMTGKIYGLIIDHVSNWKRHGLPDKYHFWTLDRREKRAKRVADPEDIPLTSCKACSRPYERFHPACPYCGAAPIVTPGGRSIEEIDGDLILLDREELARRRALTVLETPASVALRVGAAVGHIAASGQANRQIEKIQAQQRLNAAIAQWAGVQRWKGRSDQESYRRFYIATGVDVLTALSAERTRQEYEALAATVEGWYQK
jgi:DNA repair protein RadD